MEVTTEYVGGDRLAVAIRGHRLLVDQPVADGGEDQGPTPDRVVRRQPRWLRGLLRRAVPAPSRPAHDALRVEATATMSADRPARVAPIDLRLGGLGDLPPRRRDALRAVVQHCTVHNSLRQAPKVRLELASSSANATMPA